MNYKDEVYEILEQLDDENVYKFVYDMLDTMFPE